MKKQFYLAGLLTLWMFWFAPPVFSQENEAALPSAEGVEATVPEEPEVPASQEVEINEDNYRQFMELKDANRQRDIIPENVFKPGSGLQKLEKLPEESQKHLRNELREIIVQGEPWHPGDEHTEYPYTPSEAASHNPALEKQEKEAWGELVDSYHEREAQIYANSSGSQAARGLEQGSSGGPGNSAGATGDTGQNQNGEGSQGQQAGQQGKPAQSDSEGTYSLNGSNDPNATSTAGVSQNAMEFLQGLGKNGGNTGAGDLETSAENDGQGESPTPSETGSQAQTGQQDSTSQDSTAASGSPGAARDPNATSTAGTSQNAMEFLQGNSAQGETAGEGSTAAAQAKQGQGETQADQQALAQAEGAQNGQDTAQTDGQAEAPGDGQADGQAQDGQQAETAQTPASSVPPASPAPVASTEPEEESTAGASQNALEYLTGEHVQAPGRTDDASNTVQPEGTLTIQDLLNAQGIGSSTGTNPVTSGPGVEPQPDEDKPDKDGGGQ